MIADQRVLVTFEFVAKPIKIPASNDVKNKKISLNGGKDKNSQSRTCRSVRKDKNRRRRIKFSVPSSNKYVGE